KALEQRVPEAERPLYHHLFDEQENRRRGFGWIAAFASVGVVVVGAAFAWNNFMSRPAPTNLYERPGMASRGNTGYVTPQQPTKSPDPRGNTAGAPRPNPPPPAGSNRSAADERCRGSARAEERSVRATAAAKEDDLGSGGKSRQSRPCGDRRATAGAAGGEA